MDVLKIAESNFIERVDKEIVPKLAEKVEK
jgi:hypothetical protein